MRNTKRRAVGFLMAICASLLAVPFTAQAAEPSYIKGNTISSWAREGVSAAYEEGLILQTFDLGEDYTQDITRLQLARLTVDFITVEKNTSAHALAMNLGLFLKPPPRQSRRLVSCRN
jgi:hypothetical protein